MAVLLALLALTVPVPRGGAASQVRGGHAVEELLPLPHLVEWTCIHEHEGAWNDRGDPYWGGLQMDRGFQKAWGKDMIVKYKGKLADGWTPRDQIIVAERARRVRGWSPWPNTSRACGLR